ncbi:MAG: hypothetical protein AB7E08_04670 [Candidatus Omnitrophota bacterium]
MSIISDALKKAQQERKKKDFHIPTHSLPLKEEKSQKPQRKGFKTLLLLLVILSVVGGFLKFKNLKMVQWTKKFIPQRTKNIKIVPKIIPSELTQSPPEKPEEKEKISFVLSGIIFDEKDSLAIINGNLLRKGDFVEEAEVLEIEPNKVKLRYGEETIILKLP